VDVPDALEQTHAAQEGRQRPTEPPRQARGRLLQIAVFGGALLGAYIGMIAGTLEGSRTGSVLSFATLLSFLAGYVPGYALGWGTIAAARRLDPERSDRWGGQAWILLVTPAYLLAGMAAAVVAAVGVLPGMAEVTGALWGFLVTLLAAWVVLAPLTLAFAPSTSGRPKLLHRKVLGCSGTFWVSGFAALWSIGSFMTVLVVLAILDSAFPAAYERAADSSLLPILMVVAWLALWAGGSAAIYRLVRRLLLALQVDS
jgi:hypothetical protein